MRVLLLLAALTLTAQAQWQLQPAPTTADLRGIDNVGNGIAWASGTNGTILRTIDNGSHWQLCTTPPNAEHLDFRGIQAFDANTAIVMSSGPGDQSRLYKTTDACQTWKLLFTNPDKDGFWDALVVTSDDESFVLGDPVNGEFRLWSQIGDNPKWSADWNGHPVKAGKDEAAFAASNSSLSSGGLGSFSFVTGGPKPEIIFEVHGIDVKSGIFSNWRRVPLHLAAGPSAGAFSIDRPSNEAFPVVGGDYLKPNVTTGTAVFTKDWGQHWTAATTPPHGYRSAVTYDAPTKTWITVGPNGTDISTDDGRNWRALRPTPGEAPDADQHWNALSLPYAVGPHGRIGILNPSALKP
jgi:photosystem II stability/assembly factor-like uncharacterized protein